MRSCLNIDHINWFCLWLTDTELFPAELYYLSELPAEMNPNETISVVVIALSLSVLASVYPAWRASLGSGRSAALRAGQGGRERRTTTCRPGISSEPSYKGTAGSMS